MSRRSVGRLHDAVAIGCVVLAIVVTACSSGGGGSDDDVGGTATSTTAQAEATTTTAPVADIDMTAEDFKPLAEMTAVRGFFVDNALGDLEASVAVAESAVGGVYPVGTVIQLIPQEAMVKRAPGFSPDFGDWEFFELNVSADGTVIHKRGNAEITNRFGGVSCAACHSLAEPQWDFVCEQDHGCDPLPIGSDVIDALQATDPRSIDEG